jgi:hypothetical protein
MLSTQTEQLTSATGTIPKTISLEMVGNGLIRLISDSVEPPDLALCTAANRHGDELSTSLFRLGLDNRS